MRKLSLVAVSMSAALVVAGCGHEDKLALSRLPLASGARVIAQAYDCPVTPDVCFRWAIVEGDKDAQKRELVAHGWRLREGVSRAAVAADSPSGKTFVSFDTGREELAYVGRGHAEWGTPRLVRRLRELVADHRALLAVTLERGARR